MNNSERIPASNISNSVLFIVKASKRRRMQAISKAKMVQGELGFIPRLTAIK